MKEYSLHFHPISSKWRAVPQEPTLTNTAVLILSGIALVLFVFDVIPLGLMLLVWLVLAIVAVIRPVAGFFSDKLV